VKTTFALLLLATSATAQEFIATNGPLSDADFYRLVACAAPPGGACQKPFIRWSPADATDVSIGFVQIEKGYPKNIAKLASTALIKAVSEINVTDAEIHLTIDNITLKPDIGIYLLNIVEGDAIRNTGLDPLDGALLEAAKTQLWWRDDFTLINGAIVFGKDITLHDLPSVMLEEVTQSMGLLTDIGGPEYETRSIFSESSNQLTTLGAMDVIALRLHYPNAP
jgi:hypothetical protein